MRKKLMQDANKLKLGDIIWVMEENKPRQYHVSTVLCEASLYGEKNAVEQKEEYFVSPEITRIPNCIRKPLKNYQLWAKSKEELLAKL